MSNSLLKVSHSRGTALAPSFGAKGQGSWISWQQVYSTVDSRSMEVRIRTRITHDIRPARDSGDSLSSAGIVFLRICVPDSREAVGSLAVMRYYSVKLMTFHIPEYPVQTR